MKKIIILLTLISLSACSPYQSQSKIIERSPIPQIDPMKVLQNQFNELKAQSLIKENNFSSIEGLQNGATILDNELVLDNSLNFNQSIDTGVSVKDLNEFSLSVWFKTLDVSKIQMIFWQGVTTQNGWGNGSDNNAFSEFHVALNHWNNNLGNSVNVFYGFNESITLSSLSPLSFPMRQNTSNGLFEMLGIPTLITTNYTHVAVSAVKTGSNILIKLYINGELVEEGIGTQIDNSQWNSNLLLGKPGVNGQRNFYGSMKNFLSFNKSLSSEEIALIYNVQK